MARLKPMTWTALLAVTFLMGCGTRSPVAPPGHPPDAFEERQLPAEIAAGAAAVVEANNRFALDLYGQLRAREGNLFLSPYSISTAFAMVYAGAAGETEEEMASVFHFHVENLHPSFAALQKSLDRGTMLGGYELRLANRMWGQQGYPFLPAYLDITRQHYGAELQAADFQRRAESERQTINGWVAEKTIQRVSELFPQGSIKSDTRLVLANAIYFKGLWARQFEKAKTADAAFHLSAAAQVLVPTMRQEDDFRIMESGEARMLELPYLGKDLSMLVILPHRVDGLSELEANLTPQRLEEWRTRLRPVGERMVVTLPRFTFSTKVTLNEVLSAMGMPSAFDGRADFSRIDGRRVLVISGAFHEAFVAVNEEGTEAAAATGVVISERGVPSFIADHPFLFLIRDNVTGSILFLGRVVDPR